MKDDIFASTIENVSCQQFSFMASCDSGFWTLTGESVHLAVYHSKITHRVAPDKLLTQSYKIPDFIQCQAPLCFWNLKNMVCLINNAKLWRQFNPCSFVRSSQHFAKDLLRQTYETFYTVRVRSDTGGSGE